MTASPEHDMTVRARRAIIAVTCIVVWAALSARYAAHTGAQDKDDAAAEAAIRKAVVDTTEAFNRRDAAAVAEFYAPDADLVTVRGEVMKGRAEIERGLSRLFATRNKDAQLKTLDIKVRFIRPDVAVVHVTNEISQVLDATGRPLPPQRELSLRVFLKTATLWRVTAFHNILVTAPPVPVSGNGADQSGTTLSVPSNHQMQRTKPTQAVERRR